jgi:hypothetical protein
MLRILLLLPLLTPAICSAGEAPRYFITVENGAYNYKGGGAQLQESFRALEGMVKLADAQGVRLTLLFSAQSALYISSGPARLAALQAWKRTGHEVGAYHLGPDVRLWDGYSDLPGEELSRLRKDRTAKGEAPGHKEFLAALAPLEPALKSGCMRGRADLDFLKAAPLYEVCGGEGGHGGSGDGYSGVNEFVALRGAAGAKGLSVFNPAGKAGIEAAKKAFSGMSSGVYGAAFKSSPSEFGAFYAWLAFLRSVDPLGVKSRTASAVVESGLLPEKKAAPGKSGDKVKKAAARQTKKQAGKITAAETNVMTAPPFFPEEAPKAKEIPRLKPVRSFFGSVSRMVFGGQRGGMGRQGPPGRCGDGVCDAFERASKGRCPRDCGN